MLKRLILLLLFSGSLDGFSQDTVIRRTPDTLRAELLLTYTTRRWGVAHARDGYVVRKGNEIEYLDNNHKPFPPCVTVWGWVKWEDSVKRRRR